MPRSARCRCTIRLRAAAVGSSSGGALRAGRLGSRTQTTLTTIKGRSVSRLDMTRPLDCVEDEERPSRGESDVLGRYPFSTRRPVNYSLAAAVWPTRTELTRG